MVELKCKQIFTSVCNTSNEKKLKTEEAYKKDKKFIDIKSKYVVGNKCNNLDVPVDLVVMFAINLMRPEFEGT